VISLRDGDMRDAYNEAYRLFVTGSACHLMFDLSNLSYFDSTFVGIMIRLAKKASGETVLCHLSDGIQGILKQLMLLENPKTDFFWKQMETRESAIQWLRSNGCDRSTKANSFESPRWQDVSCCNTVEFRTQCSQTAQ
jgi:hypothetical protein